MRIFLLFLFSCFLLSCQNSQPKKYTSILQIKDSSSISLSLGLNKSLKHNDFTLFSNAMDNYFVTLNKSEFCFQFTSVNDSKIKRKIIIASPEKIRSYSNCIFKITDSSIYIFGIDISTLYLLRIKDDTAYIESNFDISRELISENIYIKKRNEAFCVIKNNIFLPIASKSSKNNYLDRHTHLLLKIDSLSFDIKLQKVFHYPNKFLLGLERNEDTFINNLNDTFNIFGFRAFDSIYKYNIYTNEYSVKKMFNKNSVYRSFNNSKRKDVAYIRWYETTNESNQKVVVIKNKILIIKHLVKPEINSKDIFEYYLLDSNFNILKNNIFQTDINPFFCYPFKNGFRIYNKNLTKAYYYEVD